IDLYTILPETVAQVWPGGQAGASYVAYCLSLPNPNPRPYAVGDVRHMKVLRSVGAVVTDLDVVAVVGFVLCLQHDTVAHRTNRRSCRGREVRPEMRAINLPHRMKAAL